MSEQKKKSDRILLHIVANSASLMWKENLLISILQTILHPYCCKSFWLKTILLLQNVELWHGCELLSPQ